MQKSAPVLLETQYLPPLSAFVMLKSFSGIIIDEEENFKKSTWRNRCRILNANCPLLLSIPLLGGRGVRMKTKDVRIANDEPWQKKHWRSLTAAYGSSSFFMFYDDRFRKFYERRFDFLVDFNTRLLEEILIALDLRIKVLDFEAARGTDAMRPTEKIATPKPYRQVFDYRHGFIPGVSIIDLIFNLGPDAPHYIRNTIS